MTMATGLSCGATNLIFQVARHRAISCRIHSTSLYTQHVHIQFRSKTCGSVHLLETEAPFSPSSIRVETKKSYDKLCSLHVCTRPVLSYVFP
jgi:hypothetical protein